MTGALAHKRVQPKLYERSYFYFVASSLSPSAGSLQAEAAFVSRDWVTLSGEA